MAELAENITVKMYPVVKKKLNKLVRFYKRTQNRASQGSVLEMLINKEYQEKFGGGK
jgi:hypothetical protein